MRATIILAAVAAALAAVIFFVERRAPSTDEARAGRARLLPRFERARVRRVGIVRAGAPPFSLERARGDGGGAAPWRVLPAGKPADEAAVDELLAELDFAEADRAADLSPAEAGLVPPRVRLEIDAGEAMALALGRPDAGGRGVFADAPGGGPVRVAPRRLLDLADREPAAFRDHRVVAPGPGGAGPTALSWSIAGERQQSLSQAAGRWRNERAEWVSDGRATEAVRRLTALRVERFTGAPAAPPRVERTLSLGGGGAGGGAGAAAAAETLRFTAGACPDGGGTLVERSDAAGSDWLCLAAEPAQELWRALEAAHARDDRLLGAAPDAVTRLAIAAGDRRVALDGTSGRWRFTAPAVGYAADDDAVHDWLAELARVRLDLTSPPSPAPASAPAAPSDTTLDVTAPRFAERIVVAAAGKGSSTAVQRAGEPTAARAPAALAALVAPDPLRFRDRRVLNLSRFDAQRLRLSSPGRTTDLAKSDDQSWRAVSPAGATVDTTALDRLLTTLTNLRVERYLAPDSPLAPDLTLTLTERPPATSAPVEHVLDLGPRRSDGCQARLRGDAAFTLAPAACDDLAARVAR